MQSLFRKFFAIRISVVASLFFLPATEGEEQRTAWFIDGYHGGVYGHYPPGYTAFIMEQLQKNPGWRINLEIEPETWDVARALEPEAYVESVSWLKALNSSNWMAGLSRDSNPLQAAGENKLSAWRSPVLEFALCASAICIRQPARIEPGIPPFFIPRRNARP